MTNSSSAPSSAASRLLLYGMVFSAGFAALSWEVIWQIKASLAIGASAIGTAIVLASTMGGMTAGSLLMGRYLGRAGAEVERPLRLYAALEWIIGLSGLLLLRFGFQLVEMLDVWAWRTAPGITPAVQLLAIAALLAPPTLAMGATVPLFGRICRVHGGAISVLYGLNTAGAALGTLVLALVLVPILGVSGSIGLAASINLVVGAAAFLIALPEGHEPGEAPAPTALAPAGRAPLSPRAAAALVFVTGFVTFALEVSWFRSMRAAFHATTDSFAIMLASVLIPLSIASALVPRLRRTRVPLGALVVAAGVAVLLATPVIERFDSLLGGGTSYVQVVLVGWLGLSLATLSGPVLLLGIGLPWALEEQTRGPDWARLYALNAAGAVCGALLAAWVILPLFGFATAAWGMGLLLAGTGAALLPKAPARVAAVGLTVVALAVAVVAESGVGRDRVASSTYALRDYELIDFAEGPDSTISVIARKPEGYRVLLVDGFAAADDGPTSHYMPWMGHLPMLLHPKPETALVICFGTGQTSNAVLQEGPARLDIVDLNAAVFEMASHFDINKGVLEDPRVHPHAMDGRAWLRRTETLYDVITLEPMPPNFAGVNALYSVEFYELAAAQLNPGGVVAQWLPFHLVPPEHATAIAASFAKVFPESVLWIDPISTTGILAGRTPGSEEPWPGFPGFDREVTERTLTPERVRGAVALDADGVRRFGSWGALVTDDSQLLAYGGRRLGATYASVNEFNQALVREAAAGRSAADPQP